MAMPVLNAQSIRLLLAWRPGRMEYALRLALICALTCLIAEIYQTPDIALTIYIAFFLNQKNRAASLIQNLAFAVLITVVVGVIIVIAAAVLDDPLWRVAAMALISFGCLFLASASKLRPVGGTLALVIAYALDLLGIAPVGEAATRALLYAWLFVGIPAGVSIAVNLLLAPPPRRVIERELAYRLRLAGGLLNEAQSRNSAADRSFHDVLGEGTAPLLGLLRLADLERSVTAGDSAMLRQAILSTAAILAAVDAMQRDGAAFPPEEFARAAKKAMDAVAQDLEAGRTPSAALVEIPASIRPGDQMMAAEALCGALAQFGKAREPSAAKEKDEKPKDEKQGFFLPDAFTNPDHVRYALKTTAAAMACYFLYSVIGWQGIHTSFITCYIVSLTTAAESAEKLSLRILGCLIGAAAGFAAILLVMPHLTSIGALMAVVFSGALAAAYVAGGSARISYAGFQIAFAFLLCVVQGPAPDFDFIVARDRVIGILLGNLVSYLIFANVWPVSIHRRIDAALAALLHRLALLAAETDQVHRASQASALQVKAAAIRSDLHLMEYEPEHLRRERVWCQARHRAAEEISALCSLFAVMPYDAGMDGVARSIEAAAESFEASSLRPAVSLPAVSGLLAQHHDGLLQALMDCFPEEKELRDAPA
jgi:Predicted membrane protein